MALRQRGLAKNVVGVGRRQASLDKAINCGAISQATLDIEAAVQQAELVVVCTPVASVAEDVCRALQASEAIVTDVGSTKATICHEIEAEAEADDASRFVGSHPLAGDHRTGPENARADLFEGKTVVMTLTASTVKETTAGIQEFWESLGAQVVQMTPAEHDQALASTSHLPHLVASVLAAVTPEPWLPLAATGWSDTTRVAAGDPELWTQIFAQNLPELLSTLDRLIDEFGQMRALLANEDWQQTQDYLARAKRIRDALGN